MFGSWFQTATILHVAAKGGVSRGSVRTGLRAIGATTMQIERALSALEGRGIITDQNGVLDFHAAFSAAAEAREFAKAFLAARPDFVLRYSRPRARLVRDTRGPKGLTNWNATVVGDERPIGSSPAADGSPLLFGSAARLRVLIALAVNGPTRKADLIRSTGIRQNTYERLVYDGWLARVQVAPTVLAVGVAPNIPGRATLLSLLRRLADRWPPRPTTPTPPVVMTSAKRISIEKMFGSQVRSETLLTLAAMESADVSTLGRAITSSDHNRIRASLEMLRHYGIVRRSGREGSARMFEIDSTWFAASELRSFLSDLLDIDGRYGGRRASMNMQSSGKRKKMRENAMKRKSR